MLEALIIVVFPLCMAFGAMTDLISMTIPNRVSVLLVATFCVVAPLAGFDLITIAWHFAAAFCVFAVCFVLFALNAMGGGDAKILAASALWYGFNPDLIGYLGNVGIFGAVLTFFVIVARAKSNTLIATGVPLPIYVTDNKVGVPYGIAIGLAALVTYPDTAIFAFLLNS